MEMSGADICTSPLASFFFKIDGAGGLLAAGEAIFGGAPAVPAMIPPAAATAAFKGGGFFMAETRGRAIPALGLAAALALIGDGSPNVIVDGDLGIFEPVA